MSKNSPIRYIGYYDTQSNSCENRGCVPSAKDVMDYVIYSLNRIGYPVEVVSASRTRNRSSYRGKTIPMVDGNTLKLYRTLPWGGIVRRVSSVWWSRLALFSWLLVHTRAGESVIAYHSLGYARVIAMARRLRRFRLILQIGEIYADVTGRPSDRRRELSVIRQADAFLLATEMLVDKVELEGRPYAVVHGTYRIESKRGRRWSDNRIHAVYAGTLDPRKGSRLAIAAAEFLDSRYHIHIIGFGDEADTRAALSMVEEVSQKTECRVTYDGLLAGEEYVGFLQSCDIGLSPQILDADFNESSFPSKVLSYMANGLRVVSIRLGALEHSAVGQWLHFYDRDTPEDIALAIQNVDFDVSYDSRTCLRELDEEFRQNLTRITGGSFGATN